MQKAIIASIFEILNGELFDQYIKANGIRFDFLTKEIIAILINGFKESNLLCEIYGGTIPSEVTVLVADLRWLLKEMVVNDIKVVKMEDYVNE